MKNDFENEEKKNPDAHRSRRGKGGYREPEKVGFT
jgi:hypothetical protein